MSRTDDLTPLFRGEPGTPVLKFRQGQVVAWNPNTGQNTIDVQGVQLVDVPMMNTGEAIALKAGHIVGLITMGHTWFIVGRITVPGDPDFASASLDFGLTSGQSTNFALTTSDVTFGAATIACPSWARQALVTLSAVVDLQNTRAAADDALVTPIVAAITGPTVLHGFALNGDASRQHFQAISTGMCLLVDLPGTPGQSISVGVRIRANAAAWPASAFNTATVNAGAVFKSTV